MMAQYLEVKERYPDALLFYRMGDFYEMFFDDAEAAAVALDIALTKRGKHLGEDISMCGVPHHAAEGYLLTLIRKGFRVAVCEQLESPAEAKKRGYKAVVKRDVVRLVTPGTLTEDALLEARRHNFLASFSEIRGDGALAWVDVSTGDIQVTACTRTSLGPMLARLAPSELLVSETMLDECEAVASDYGVALTPLARASFDSDGATARLSDLYKVKSLESFGSFSRTQLSALGGIIDYLDLTQRGKLPLMRPPVVEAAGGVVQIDGATRRNLELTRSLSGGRDGSLLQAIDRTITGAGARLLELRLTSPSTDLHTIAVRHDAVEFCCEHAALCTDLRDDLRKVPDIERALSRLSLDRGGPRDLTSLRDGLGQAETIAQRLYQTNLPVLLSEAGDKLKGHEKLTTLLDSALVAEPPLLARDGGFVATGYDDELDEARKLRDEGRSVIAAMQTEYADLSGIKTLKIKHNNVLGYFVETPASNAAKMLAEPLSETFIHRQTTANQVRFTTVKLSEMETRILNAGGHALEIEKRIFDELRSAVLASAGPVAMAAKALAEFDLATSFADLAIGENWARPEMSSDRCFQIDAGRHPVVERALRQSGATGFVANDCDLSADTDGSCPIWLLTGPNMAGKSTFLRQNALIALLAQTGAFVPAAAARIGVVDQVFSRVGASDDLARGQSTFMVEMVETAAILNQAGPKALVILDEIGRGTATYDGLSIAWATLEHLHDVNQCRALFATHYHEMTVLAGKMKGLKNATVTVREWEGDVIFLHEVSEGAADRSYGVQVARLAGLPAPVVERARTILDKLEQNDREGDGKAKTLIDDLPLFNIAPPSPQATIKQSVVEARLEDIHPDELTPKEALSLVYELRDLLKPN